MENETKAVLAPMVGEAVVYLPSFGEARAALVTHAGPLGHGAAVDQACPTVSLTVFPRRSPRLVGMHRPDAANLGLEYFDDVSYSPKPAPGCWGRVRDWRPYLAAW